MISMIAVLLLLVSSAVAAGDEFSVLIENPFLSSSEPVDNPYLEYLLGQEAEISGKWEVALSHYSRALQLDPKSAHLQTQISQMLINGQDK